MKRFSIFLIILFSAFLVLDRVNAEEIPEGCIIDDTIDNSCITDSMIEDWNPGNFDSYVVVSYSNNYYINYFNYNDMLSKNIYFYETSNYYALGYNSNISYANGIVIVYSGWDSNNVSFTMKEYDEFSYGPLSPTTDLTNYPVSSLNYYTNVDILDENGEVVLEKNSYDISDFTDPVFTKKDLDNIIKNNNIDTSIYDNYFIFFKEWYSSGNKYYVMHLYLFKNDDLDNIYIKDNSEFWSNPSTSLYYEYVNSVNKKIDISLYNENMNFYNNWNYNNFDSLTKNYIYYSNVDIKDNNGNITFPKRELPVNNEDVEEEFTINFHLNGGTVTIPNVEICDDIGCYIKDEIYYEDYSIKLSSKDFENYIKSLKIEKQNMRFQGFFYDKQFTNEISNNFLIDSDKDIYAKWGYTDVNDFLKDNTFNSYTFDTNYAYAIISIGKNYGQDIYLGLDFLGYNLEIYRYRKDETIQDEGSSFCITPYYSKGEKYYYRIETTDNDYYNVFVLPRVKLETVQNGEVINYYNFLVTNNAHVTYTNDLKKIEIYDDNNNKIIIDLEDRYNYAQDALISDESNLLEIFKELLGNMNDNIFSYFNQVWNQFKTNKIYMYLMLLIAGSVVIVIIKAANRK